MIDYANMMVCYVGIMDCLFHRECHCYFDVINIDNVITAHLFFLFVS